MIDIVWGFVSGKTPGQLIALLWYFIFFDFVRYTFSDVVVLFYVAVTKPLARRKERAARKRLFHRKPLVSVLVPGKNEGEHLFALAESLKKQTYKNLELIVVDDGSDDATPAICRVLQRNGLISLYFRNPHRGGKASAANLALRYSKGEYIVHLDADSHLRHDSIEKILLPFFYDGRVGAVAGDIRVANMDADLAPILQSLEYMRSLTMGRTVNSMFGILRIVSGAYGAFRRDILDRIKGWDIGPGLDGDITLKFRKLGYRIHFEPSAVCYTNVPVTFTGLARQRYRWDRSLVRFRLRKHADILTFDRNFRISNFISTAENIFFNLVLDFKWWLYLIATISLYPDALIIIFLLNYLLYLAADIIGFTCGCLLMGRSLRWSELRAGLYIPLMPIYTGFYLRFVRTYSYMMELIFKASYIDKWNPWKTSRIAEEEGM